MTDRGRAFGITMQFWDSLVTENRIHSRALIAGAVLLVHLTLLTPLAFHGVRGALHAGRPAPFVTVVQIIVQSDAWDRVPVPDIALEQPSVPELTLETVRFADSLEDELAGISGPASAPRLSRFQIADVSVYVRRAHVRAGRPATVVLIVNVLEDGRSGSVDVRRRSGDSAVDAAAVDYALELRWIPGTKNQQPQAMRVLLPVTLTTSS